MCSAEREKMSESQECFGFRFKKHMIVVPKDVGESENMFRYRYWWIVSQFDKDGCRKNKEELIIESRLRASERFLKVRYEE